MRQQVQAWVSHATKGLPHTWLHSTVALTNVCTQDGNIEQVTVPLRRTDVYFAAGVSAAARQTCRRTGWGSCGLG